jgi:hypothetical protein
MGSSGLVTIVRADVATAEEAAAVFAVPAALRRQAVATVVHASGVLKVSKCSKPGCNHGVALNMPASFTAHDDRARP